MKIVLSHKSTGFHALARQAEAHNSSGDLVELRLDGMPPPREGELRSLIRRLGKPVIVAAHGPEAFGDFQGSDAERVELLSMAARAGASFVDVDVRLASQLGGLPLSCRCIISHHDRERVPEDLGQLLRDLRLMAGEHGLVKLVAHANCAEDGMRLLAALRDARGARIGFCSGEVGRFTRVLCGLHGSEWTYCVPPALPQAQAPQPTGPGQFTPEEMRVQMPAGGLSDNTRVFGVVGNPIRHSWSPRLHTLALRRLGADAVYVAFEVRDLLQFLGLLAYPNYEGFSVAAPHKEPAFQTRAARDESVERMRAVNTLVRLDGIWHAHNTDVVGVREVLRRAFGRMAVERPLGGLRVLVLGSGGAARAALEAVSSAGGSAFVAARNLERSTELARELGARAVAVEQIAGVAWDGLVHCTPQGSLADPGKLPIEARLLRPGAVVVDSVYRPRETPLMKAARERGCQVYGGGEWFVQQAVQQFVHFTGAGIGGAPRFGRTLGVAEIEKLYRDTLAMLYTEVGE
ncbi:MAG: type I 3-dehydroquinate dehydratase [Planctomycetes bacterium]|nr:type I 3-dehydroquinate dehydratase [Planctomycetota bacterium]